MSEIEGHVLAGLKAENKALREELQTQWESNHFEHCGVPVPPYVHDGCQWPMPVVLASGDGPKISRVQP